MKSLLAAIIAISYLCLSTGITMHMHYCMGKQVGTSLFAKGDAHKCSHCGMEKKSSKNGCCKDEHKTVKAKNVIAISKVSIQYIPTPEFVGPITSPLISTQTALLNTRRKSINGRPHGPPTACAIRLHVRHCVFLI